MLDDSLNINPDQIKVTRFKSAKTIISINNYSTNKENQIKKRIHSYDNINIKKVFKKIKSKNYSISHSCSIMSNSREDFQNMHFKAQSNKFKNYKKYKTFEEAEPEIKKNTSLNLVNSSNKLRKEFLDDNASERNNLSIKIKRPNFLIKSCFFNKKSDDIYLSKIGRSMSKKEKEMSPVFNFFSEIDVEPNMSLLKKNYKLSTFRKPFKEKEKKHNIDNNILNDELFNDNEDYIKIIKVNSSDEEKEVKSFHGDNNDFANELDKINKMKDNMDTFNDSINKNNNSLNYSEGLNNSNSINDEFMSKNHSKINNNNLSMSFNNSLIKAQEEKINSMINDNNNINIIMDKNNNNNDIIKENNQEYFNEYNKNYINNTNYSNNFDKFKNYEEDNNFQKENILYQNINNNNILYNNNNQQQFQNNINLNNDNNNYSYNKSNNIINQNNMQYPYINNTINYIFQNNTNLFCNNNPFYLTNNLNNNAPYNYFLNQFNNQNNTNFQNQFNPNINTNNINNYNNYYNQNNNNIFNYNNNSHFNNNNNYNNKKKPYINNNIENNIVDNYKDLSKINNVELAKISHILAKRKDGSKFLENIIDSNPSLASSLFFPYSLAYFEEISNNKYGNFYIKKIIKYLNKELLSKLIEFLSPLIIRLGTNQYGSKIIEQLIKSIKDDDNLVLSFIQKIIPNITLLINDLNGTHIIYKLLLLKSKSKSLVEENILKNIKSIYISREGSNLLKKFFDIINKECNLNKDYKKLIIFINIINNNLPLIITDQYGNYLIRHIVCDLNNPINGILYKNIINNLIYYSNQKYSSNVVENCLDNVIWRDLIIEEFSKQNVFNCIFLNEYGNYVIQKVISLANETQKNIFFNYIINVSKKLQTLPFGPKLISKLIMNYPKLSMYLIGMNNR